MSEAIHPAAPHHLPFFITAPTETDVLLNFMAIFLVVMILAFLVLYFRLHALPEQLAHKGQKIQFEIVAVLALLALFTHNHLFWVAGLLLALIPLPDFSTPLARMADSLATMAGRRRRAEDVDGRLVSEPQEIVGSKPLTARSVLAPAESLASITSRSPAVDAGATADTSGGTSDERQRVTSGERA
jgi:hypothetical protein